jgi:hypothetical protein
MGVFTKREPPFFTKKAYDIYDKTVGKFSKLPNEEVLVCLRNDNHVVVKCWSNAKPMVSFKERLKLARGKR